MKNKMEIKQDKALGMVSYLLDHQEKEISALAFSVVAGTLESLVTEPEYLPLNSSMNLSKLIKLTS